MRFLVLDGWRGVCAMMVALFHLSVTGHIFPGSLDHVRLIGNAWLFVDFFFVLSGFIITHSLSGGLEGRRGLAAFAIRRFGRLWPTHLAMVGLMLGYQMAKSPPSLGQVVFDYKSYTLDDAIMSLSYYLAFVHALPGFYRLGVGHLLDINPPSWSISVEYWIYLAFGLSLLASRPVRRVLVAVAILGSGLTLFWMLNAIGTTFEYGLLRCSYGFFVGHGVYGLYRATRWELRRWGRLATALELAAVTVALVFVVYWGLGPASLLAPVVFGLSVYVFAFEAGAVSSWMTAAPIQLLGRLSFTIYMGHAFVVLVWADLIWGVQGWLGVHYSFQREMYGEVVTLVSFRSLAVADLSALIYALLVVGFAALLSRWVEVPWRDRVNRVAKQIAAGAAASPAAVGDYAKQENS
jgi:peptidoglycan/LPS O-acetylase OafA/YrhL